MKIKKIVKTGIILSLAALALTACKKNEDSKTTISEASSTEIVVGVCPGPYGDMINNVVAPLMKEKGFDLTTKEFNDYIQPNKALADGKIDANLFQHSAYLKKFSEDNNLDLTAVGQVPTLGMGIYSKKLTSLSEVTDKSTVAIANDASNLARSLQLLDANELVTLPESIDETKATIDDIATNPKNLEFKTLEAAQLPRSLDNVDIALIPGNYSWSAELDPGKALALEDLTEDYKNVIVVRTDEIDGDLAKAFKEVLASQEFKDAIAKSEFKDFSAPASWNE